MVKEGEQIPNITFVTRTRVPSINENPFNWRYRTTEELFKNKRIVLFAVPGAFGPICSSTHLPGYIEKYNEIINLNVDDVYCLSVNDAFVMRRWGLDLGLEEDFTLGSLGFKTVKLLPDGAGFFTQLMGMACHWTSERGFGERSWRYSAVINNGVVEKLFVETPALCNSKEDPFRISDASTMLYYLNSVNKKIQEIDTSPPNSWSHERPKNPPYSHVQHHQPNENPDESKTPVPKTPVPTAHRSPTHPPSPLQQNSSHTTPALKKNSSRTIPQTQKK